MKIWVIENQIVQYRSLRDFLESKGHIVLPAEEDFIEFIDHVRVSLNSRYGKRCPEAKNWVIEKGKIYAPDGIVMDHILVGPHDGGNGIDLAIELRKEGINVPIVFFSRTEINNPEVCEKLSQISDSQWVSKGNTLEGKSGKEYIISAMERLLTKKEENSDYNAMIKLLDDRKPVLGAHSDKEDRKLAGIINDFKDKLKADKNIKITLEELQETLKLSDRKLMEILKNKMGL